MTTLIKCFPRKKIIKKKTLRKLARLILWVDRSAIGKTVYNALFASNAILSAGIGFIDSADEANIRLLITAFINTTLSASSSLSGQVLGIPFPPQSGSGSTEILNIAPEIDLATQPIAAETIAHQKLTAGFILLGINILMLSWQSAASASNESIRFYRTQSANNLDGKHSKVSNKGIKRNHCINFGTKVVSYTLLQLSIILALYGSVMYKIEDGVKSVGLIQEFKHNETYSGGFNPPLPTINIPDVINTFINPAARVDVNGTYGYEFYAGPDFREGLSNDGLFILGWAAALFGLNVTINLSKSIYDCAKKKFNRNHVDNIDLELGHRTQVEAKPTKSSLKSGIKKGLKIPKVRFNITSQKNYLTRAFRSCFGGG